jgi:hypothetical protein
MARFIDFQWVERDPRICTFYSDYSKKLTSTQGLDPTNTAAYRLNTDVLPAAGAKELNFKLKAELLEDVEFELSSEFGDPSDLLPGGNLIAKLGSINNAFTGKEASITNIFKIPMWASTAPLSLTLSVLLYTRTNAVLDVLVPALSLASMTILKSDGTGGYNTPGFFLGNVASAFRSRQKAGEGKLATDAAGNEIKGDQSKDFIDNVKGNFLKARIINLINLPLAMLVSCKPKFSKQLTESGAPLWAVLEMKIQTALPATTDDLFSEFIKDSGKSLNFSSTTSKATTVFN